MYNALRFIYNALRYIYRTALYSFFCTKKHFCLWW